MKLREWFIDDREELHCCFCGVRRETAIGASIMNHEEIKHIVCSSCLYHLINITNIIQDSVKK